MITQDDIFGITDDAAFEAAALEVFRRQAAECPPYREYLALAGVRPEEVRAAREIPFLPIEIFKTHDVYCGGTEPEAVFTSSATTGMTPSRHPMRSLALSARSTANRGSGASMPCCPITCAARGRRWSTWPTG